MTDAERRVVEAAKELFGYKPTAEGSWFSVAWDFSGALYRYEDFEALRVAVDNLEAVEEKQDG